MVRGSGEASALAVLSYSVFVRGVAERDVSEAQSWYEQQQPGLAAEFNIEFNATLEILEETPLIYQELYRGVRRAILHRFPYLVWYRVQDAKVTVLACTHGKVRPAKLRSVLEQK